MTENCPMDVKSKEGLAENNRTHSRSADPYIQFKYAVDEKTGKNVPKEIVLSDGTPLNEGTLEGFKAAFQRVTGVAEPEQALRILSILSGGFQDKALENRLSEASSILSAFKPQDEMEALLLGQFLALTQAGHGCLRQFYDHSNLQAMERFGVLSSKLFAQANASVQALLKYRSRGQQSIQVVHMVNQGQAILTQNLEGGWGALKKSIIEPHG